MCEVLMVISYPRNTTQNQSRNQRWMETLKQELTPPAIIGGTSLTGKSITEQTLSFYFAISSNLSEAKRKKSISVSVINLAVGEKFSSFSLRRKSSSFLDVSGKEKTEINDDSSNESEEEKDSFSNPPTPPTPPKRISSLKPNKAQIPIPAPRKISTVSLPVRLARLGFRLCKFAFTSLLHHLTLLLFPDPLLNQSFTLPGAPQLHLQYQMRPQQILSI